MIANENNMTEQGTYRFNNSTVRIIDGDITDSQLEVIVSADNYTLQMAGGVSKAILSKGGNAIKIDAWKKVPANLGSVVVTTAGDLLQKYIFHAITVEPEAMPYTFNVNVKHPMFDDIQRNRFIVENAVDECFRLMEALNIHSIAFPALGAGHGHIPYDIVAETMTAAIYRNLVATHKQLSIELYLNGSTKTMTMEEHQHFHDEFSNFMAKAPIDVMQVQEDARAQENKADVFISYCHKDINLINPILKILDEMGISYFIDRDDALIGINYNVVLERNIRDCKIFLMFFTENYNQSKSCAYEVWAASNQDKDIIPFRFDNITYCDRIITELRRIDWIEYYPDSDKEFAITRLKMKLSLMLQNHALTKK